MEPVLIPGLRGRLLRGLLAPARGIPGRECPSRSIGVDQSRAGRRAEGSSAASVMTFASGRWAERNRDLVDLEAAELGLRLLIA